MNSQEQLDQPGYFSELNLETERIVEDIQFRRGLRYSGTSSILYGFDKLAKIQEFASQYEQFMDGDPEIEQICEGIDPIQFRHELVAKPPRDNSLFVHKDIINSGFGEKLFQNKTIANILGHAFSAEGGYWNRHNYDFPEKTPLLQIDIDNDTYGTYGRCLLIDAFLTKYTREDLRELYEQDIDAYLLYMASYNTTESGTGSTVRRKNGQSLSYYRELIADEDRFKSIIEKISDDSFYKKVEHSLSYEMGIIPSSYGLLVDTLAMPEANDPALRCLRKAVGQDAINSRNFAQVRDLLASGMDEKVCAKYLVTTMHSQRGKIIAMANNPANLELFDINTLEGQMSLPAIYWGRGDFTRGSDYELADLVETLRNESETDPALLISRYPRSEATAVFRNKELTTRISQDIEDRLQRLYLASKRASASLAENLPSSSRRAGNMLTVAETQPDAVRTIRTKLSELLAQAQSIRVQSDNTALVDFQIQQLEALQAFDFTKFPQNIGQLARYKKHFSAELMVTLLDRTGQSATAENIFEQSLERMDTEWLMGTYEYVEHILVGRILEKVPDLDKADKQAIRQILSMEAFEPLINRKRSKETVDISFVPARGMLLEASGHIANACWAEKMNITTEHPNIDALILVKESAGSGENALPENFAGAGLLIRTKADDGTPLLILRGFNPAQSLLNKVNAEDLFHKTMEYVRKIAEQDGRQAAIVIDDHSGGSASNRPEIFKLQTTLKPSLKRISVPSGNTTFNDYDITEDTYLI